MSGTGPAERAPHAVPPEHLAAKILRSKSELEGRRTPVTVLYATLRSEHEDEPLDSDARRLLEDRFLAILSDPVHRFEGTIHRHNGGGILAFFGAPIAHSDHAERACYAALQAARGLRSFADELRRARGLSVQLSVGLDSGELLISEISNDLRMSFSEAVPTVARGRRAAELAPNGGAYLTDRTAREVEGLFKLRDRGPFVLGPGGDLERLRELEGKSPMRDRVVRARRTRPPIQRRSAAILNADAVGYSRLMAEDEIATVDTLSAHREEMTSLVERHDGRVVDAPGDNLLAEFSSAREAVHCALATQRAVQGRNRELPLDRRMEFRIGIHQAEVMVEGDRLYGGGVNIAARLERLAQPGGICISGSVFAEIGHEPDLRVEDLGDQWVKNLPEPVRAYRLHPLGGAEGDESRPM